MTMQEIKQLLALLTRIAEACELQNRLNAEWIAYRKEEDQQDHQDKAQHLANAVETNKALLEFLSIREQKMMQTIDLLCERTAVPMPDWWGEKAARI